MATSGDKKTGENKTQQTSQQASRRQPSRPQASEDQKQERSSDADQKQGRSSNAPKGRVPIAEAMRLAAGQLAELLQREPASVSSVKATDEGWNADVEVVEVERVPETTSEHEPAKSYAAFTTRFENSVANLRNRGRTQSRLFV